MKSQMILASLLGLSFCESSDPPRPNGLPEDAKWLGGVDGGYWIVCTVLDENVRYNCSVFEEHSGDLFVKGDYVSDDPMNVAELEFDFFDGNVFVTTDGRTFTRGSD